MALCGNHYVVLSRKGEQTLSHPWRRETELPQMTLVAALICGEKLQRTGLSNRSIELIMNSWKESTLKQYQTYFDKWNVYIKDNDIPANSPSINDIVEFLTFLFDQGLGYSAINTARSSLSSLYTFDGKSVGEHTLVVRLLKGIFNERPALPRKQRKLGTLRLF